MVFRPLVSGIIGISITNFVRYTEIFDRVRVMIFFHFVQNYAFRDFKSHIDLPSLVPDAFKG